LQWRGAAWRQTIRIAIGFGALGMIIAGFDAFDAAFYSDRGPTNPTTKPRRRLRVLVITALA
jgi:hypothetical protein